MWHQITDEEDNHLSFTATVSEHSAINPNHSISISTPPPKQKEFHNLGFLNDVVEACGNTLRVLYFVSTFISFGMTVFMFEINSYAALFKLIHLISVSTSMVLLVFIPTNQEQMVEFF